MIYKHSVFYHFCYYRLWVYSIESRSFTCCFDEHTEAFY